MKSNSTKGVLIAAILGFVLILYFIFFSDYKPFQNIGSNKSIEDKYGIALNLPIEWSDKDCSESSKRYHKEFRVVCRWSSPPHPDSGEITSVYLSTTNTDVEVSYEDVIKFAQERQSYGWEREMKRNSNILVEFDETITDVSYKDFKGIRLDDYVGYIDTEGWYSWSSTFIPIKTEKANIILEISNIDDRIFFESVFYTPEDILQNVVVLD